MTATRPPLVERIAGAPITWGVSEVPGWGAQLDAAVVLRQMRELGLAATEFGPEGFLPDSAADKAAVLRAAGLRLVGQFVPVVLHDPGRDPLPDVSRAIDGLVAAGADTLVLAASTGTDGYDSRPELDDAGWRTLLTNLDRLAALATAQGLTPTLHPHVGTMVETGEETQRVLDGSRIGLCLDTGHLLIGGGDPLALASHHPDRVAHVHLKDVDLQWADRVRRGETTYTDAVRGGIFRPLGQGQADIAALITTLEREGYSGWYVLEQDAILTTGPAGDVTPDPLADARASVAAIHAIASSLDGRSA
ncbi:MAG: TIM barrel protein [Micrococcales bacterium]|nr:TIM barrel protein [Micrococcales bacterium]